MFSLTPLTKHYPPDTTACIFWLKNRKPKEWRDRAELATDQEIAGVPNEMLEEFRKRFMATVACPDRNACKNPWQIRHTCIPVCIAGLPFVRPRKLQLRIRHVHFPVFGSLTMNPWSSTAANSHRD
jgi:hypothetical protein